MCFSTCQRRGHEGIAKAARFGPGRGSLDRGRAMRAAEDDKRDQRRVERSSKGVGAAKAWSCPWADDRPEGSWLSSLRSVHHGWWRVRERAPVQKTAATGAAARVSPCEREELLLPGW